jgi:phosphoribosylaminoimidazolecarboxamide formyltransferase/IMP cyclohydrolase
MARKFGKEKYALMALSDKTDCELVAKRLLALEYNIIASSGTAKYLRGHKGLRNGKIISVPNVTDWGPILDHRVVTLHPRIFGGILAKLPKHLRSMRYWGIPRIDFVYVGLYELWKMTANDSIEAIVEKIDIGGVALLRAAAKNHERVIPAFDTKSCELALSTLEMAGVLSVAQHMRLASETLDYTSNYDKTAATLLRGKIPLHPLHV